MGGASDNVDPDIVEELLSMLDKNNGGRPNHITPSNEVIAFIVSDNTDTGGFRDTVENSKPEGLKRIYETDPHYMQLQYPLRFPWGTEGYHKRIPLINNKYSEIENLDNEDLDPDSKQRRHVSLREYYCYKIMIQTSEDWVSTHQTTIRADLYNSVCDALSKGDHDPMHVGKAVILPASFTGSQRYMSQYFKDSLAICRAIGHPSLFLTMNCNSKWPEIQELLKLLPNVNHVDAPDIVSRVFKLKLDQLLDLIKKKNYFGKCIGVMHVDQLVSAEIPDKNSDPIAYKAVKNYMMHGPCDLMGHDTSTMLLKKKSNKSGNEQTARFVKNLDESSADLENVCNNATSKKSKLEAWFVVNSEFPQARNFTYSHFPTHFTWIKKTAKWNLRQRGDVVGRLAEIHATTGELLYLQMLSLRCKGALSFTQLRTIHGTTYDTFKEACGVLGLLNNDKQWHDALEENAFSAMPI
ncbi:uncharacterized protein LOC141673947 [Apium graveolens]|uniref:uncharacterized protein LOC141673947 n=1 Tax=Apium graveolens TaxID=4045 RepID=UPI003D79B393